MLSHTAAIAQGDAMDVEDATISIEVLETLGINTGDGKFFSFRN